MMSIMKNASILIYYNTDFFVYLDYLSLSIFITYSCNFNITDGIMPQKQSISLYFSSSWLMFLLYALKDLI